MAHSAKNAVAPSLLNSVHLQRSEGLTALYHYQFAQPVKLDNIWIDIVKAIDKIIFAQNSGIIEVSKETMESQPLKVQSDSLKAIGILLYKAILAEKALQTAQEAGKIIIKQASRNLIQDSFGLRQP